MKNVKKALITKLLVLISTLSLTACLDGSGGGFGQATTSNPTANPAPTPTIDVLASAGCTVVQLVNGVQLNCNGTSAILSNGTNGTNGLQGAVGPAGTTGATGNAGPSTALYIQNANGITYQRLQFVQANSSYLVTYDGDSGAVVANSIADGKPLYFQTVYFTTTDCSGNYYIAVDPGMPYVFKNLILINYYSSCSPGTLQIASGPTTIIPKSYLSGSSCTSVPSNTSSQKLFNALSIIPSAFDQINMVLPFALVTQ